MPTPTHTHHCTHTHTHATPHPQSAIVGPVAQVKIPHRLIRQAFGVREKDGPAEHAVALVRGVMVIIHADGVRQPGSVLADIRGKAAGDGYLSTKDYGALLLLLLLLGAWNSSQGGSTCCGCSSSPLQPLTTTTQLLCKPLTGSKTEQRGRCSFILLNFVLSCPAVPCCPCAPCCAVLLQRTSTAPARSSRGSATGT
jgi:hypothetical protein